MRRHFTPVIEAAIPEDLQHARATVTSRINAINAELAKHSHRDRQSAILMAATALSNSGVSACGRPSAIANRER